MFFAYYLQFFRHLVKQSQGQSIDRLKVDLRQTFASGQVYTALSRATSHETMRVVGFDRARVKVDQKVKQFYSEAAKTSQLVSKSK